MDALLKGFTVAIGAFAKAVAGPASQSAQDVRLDADGYVYLRDFSGNWIPKLDLMGIHERDSNWSGTARIKHGLFGPLRGRDGPFADSETPDGKPLFERED